jgi:hypothetical protein
MSFAGAGEEGVTSTGRTSAGAGEEGVISTGATSAGAGEGVTSTGATSAEAGEGVTSTGATSAGAGEEGVTSIGATSAGAGEEGITSTGATSAGASICTGFTIAASPSMGVGIEGAFIDVVPATAGNTVPSVSILPVLDPGGERLVCMGSAGTMLGSRELEAPAKLKQLSGLASITA